MPSSRRALFATAESSLSGLIYCPEFAHQPPTATDRRRPPTTAPAAPQRPCTEIFLQRSSLFSHPVPTPFSPRPPLKDGFASRYQPLEPTTLCPRLSTAGSASPSDTGTDLSTSPLYPACYTRMINTFALAHSAAFRFAVDHGFPYIRIAINVMAANVRTYR